MAENGYLTDAEGKKSSTRLMSMICLWVGIVISLVSALSVVGTTQAFDKAEYYFLGGLIAIFLILAFMPKVLQKLIEKAIEVTRLNGDVITSQKKPSSPK